MKKHLALIAVLAAMVALTACGKQTANDSAAETTAPVTDAETTEEETTEPPTNAPVAEGDANACTFDEVGADVAVLVVDDDAAADGTLTIEEIDGNKMLKFTDQTTTAENIEDAVQKIRFDVTKLLAQDQLELVDHIEFDLYAQAKDTIYVNEDGENQPQGDVSGHNAVVQGGVGDEADPVVDAVEHNGHQDAAAPEINRR